ncbi:Zinc finger, RING-type [Corchorus capsularis]|uniref:Zinc finger, RING-type n=1 Tax=Corchorus capsularis TaxID=210143 RepID=A0A1R3GG76_COCAP|nr:Zinc finger, RING-type [Corchorus capsularis]
MRKPTKTKLICSICYEDLKPAVENLQSISVCGHVFHENCLQRWIFSSSSKSSSYNCPLCRKRCAKAQATRLYFQSVEDEEDQRDYEEKEITAEEANRWLDEKLKELEVKTTTTKINHGSQVLASNRKYEALGSSSRREGTTQPGIAVGGYVQPSRVNVNDKRNSKRARMLEKRARMLKIDPLLLNSNIALQIERTNGAQTNDPFFF